MKSWEHRTIAAFPKRSEVLRPSSSPCPTNTSSLDSEPAPPMPTTGGSWEAPGGSAQPEMGSLPSAASPELSPSRWEKPPHTGLRGNNPSSLPGLEVSSPHLQSWSCSLTSTRPPGQHKVPNPDFCLPTAKQPKTHPGTLNTSSCWEQNTSRIIAVPPEISFYPPSISIQLKNNFFFPFGLLTH